MTERRGRSQAIVDRLAARYPVVEKVRTLLRKSDPPSQNDGDSNIPRHVAFIIDGNRRWAVREGKRTEQGHQEGADNIGRIIDASRQSGVDTVSVFLLSKQNLRKRDSEELGHLKQIIKDSVIVDLTSKLIEDGVKVNFIGDKKGLPLDMRYKLWRIRHNRANKRNTEGTVNFALNYDGQADIVHAVRKLRKNPLRKTTDAAIERKLSTAGQPPVDLLVRTGGDNRTSGFLVWQAANAEIHINPKYWPEFTPEDLSGALKVYANADRRGGK